MVQASVNLRQDPVKKVIDRLLVNAAVNEATRIKKSVPLPEQEANQLASAIIEAGQKGIVLRLTDILGQQGGNLVVLLEVITPKTPKPKNEAKKVFAELMKKQGRWKGLGNAALSFATKMKIPAMQNLPFATAGFLNIYDLKK